MLAAIVELGYKPGIAPSKIKPSQHASAKTEQWTMPELLESALRKANATQKPVFIDFFAEWCGACKTLEKTTFVHPAVKQAFTHFVFVKLDTDIYPDTAKHYKIVGMPTLVVMNGNGEEIYRHVGPIEAEKLAQDLVNVKDL